MQKRTKHQLPILEAIRCCIQLPCGTKKLLKNVHSLQGYKNIRDIAFNLYVKKHYREKALAEACNISLGLSMKWCKEFEERMNK